MSEEITQICDEISQLYSLLEEKVLGKYFAKRGTEVLKEHPQLYSSLEEKVLGKYFGKRGTEVLKEHPAETNFNLLVKNLKDKEAPQAEIDEGLLAHQPYIFVTSMEDVEAVIYLKNKCNWAGVAILRLENRDDVHVKSALSSQSIKFLVEKCWFPGKAVA